MQGGEGVVVRGRVEIDTRQPFSSVREAVLLFGEKVLAGEVYGNKFIEMQNKAKIQPSKLGEVTAELEETKLNLTKAKEELEQTKKELRKLKTRETLSHILDDPEEEEIKFVEKTKNVEMIGTPEKHVEFEKKRSVKFASPLLAKTIDINVEEPTTKTKKTKKKPLVPLFGGLFLKKIKKGARGSDS